MVGRSLRKGSRGCEVGGRSPRGNAVRRGKTQSVVALVNERAARGSRAVHLGSVARRTAHGPAGRG